MLTCYLDMCLTTCGSDRDHSLQTNAEVLLLVKLQFLQSDSRLPDELVVSELVLVAH